MNSLTRTTFALITLILFMMPYLITAQTTDPQIDRDSLDEMPILNPNTNAAIKIYNPPENLVFEMPIIGNKKDAKLDLKTHYRKYVPKCPSKKKSKKKK